MLEFVFAANNSFFKIFPTKNMPISIVAVVLAGIILIVLIVTELMRFMVKKAENYLDGDDGEILVEEELGKLPDEFILISDLKKLSGGNVDFVVIGPTGVFALEVKTAKTRWGKSNIEGSFRQAVKNAAFLGAQLRQALADKYLFVRPVVVVVGTDERITEFRGGKTIAEVVGIQGLVNELMKNSSTSWGNVKIERAGAIWKQS